MDTILKYKKTETRLIQIKLLGTKTLETDRLILRKFKLGDEIQIFKNLRSDSNTSQYVGWDTDKDISQTLEYVKECIEEANNNGFHWVVEIKDTHELIGDISVFEIRKKHLNCEIGYSFGSKFWGKGYATEALKCILEYLLNECEFYLVEAKHQSLNPASGRVMEKAGMKKDAVLRQRRINKVTKQINDLVVYSITKEDLK